MDREWVLGHLEFESGRRIGEGEGAFVIAEAGVNHNGDLKKAKSLIDSAAKAGADAVKFQTFSTEHLIRVPMIKRRVEQ